MVLVLSWVLKRRGMQWQAFRNFAAIQAAWKQVLATYLEPGRQGEGRGASHVAAV